MTLYSKNLAAYFVMMPRLNVRNRPALDTVYEPLILIDPPRPIAPPNVCLNGPGFPIPPCGSREEKPSSARPANPRYQM